MKHDNLRALKMEAYRLSELSLSSEIDAMAAADHRAMGFCAVVIAAAAVLTGLFEPGGNDFGLLLASAILTVSAALAGYSARPKLVYYPGANYADLLEDIQRNRCLLDVVGQLARFNDQGSAHNRQVQLQSSRIMLAAYVLAMAGLAVALVTQFSK